MTLKAEEKYWNKYNFEDKSEDANDLAYRHTTTEVIDFAKAFAKELIEKEIEVKKRKLQKAKEEIQNWVDQLEQIPQSCLRARQDAELELKSLEQLLNKHR